MDNLLLSHSYILVFPFSITLSRHVVRKSFLFPLHCIVLQEKCHFIWVLRILSSLQACRIMGDSISQSDIFYPETPLELPDSVTDEMVDDTILVATLTNSKGSAAGVLSPLSQENAPYQGEDSVESSMVKIKVDQPTAAEANVSMREISHLPFYCHRFISVMLLQYVLPLKRSSGPFFAYDVAKAINKQCRSNGSLRKVNNMRVPCRSRHPFFLFHFAWHGTVY